MATDSAWDPMIIESLIGEKRCFVGGIGDATNGFLLGHVFNDVVTDMPDEEKEKWNYLYSEEEYAVEVLADDLETKNSVMVCEPGFLKSAIDSEIPLSQGVYLGRKKFRVIQVTSFAARSYPDSNVKCLIIALDKFNGCIAIEGGYYVLAIIDTREVEQKNLAVELACDLVAYLAQEG